MLFSAELLWYLVFGQKFDFQEKSQKISQSSYFTRRPTELEGETEKSQRGATPPVGAAQAWPRLHMVWPPRLPPRVPLSPIYCLCIKNTGGSSFFQKEFRCSAATENPRSGTRNSVLALCRDGELEEIIAIVITNASPSTIHASPIHV